MHEAIMRMIFLDESGFTSDWVAGMSEQPFYTLSAVCVHADKLGVGYDALRESVRELRLPKSTFLLGQGHEIKARDIATGAGWWGKHTKERNKIREYMLSFPRSNEGTAFLVIIDKKAHFKKYYSPDNPYMLALRFILERIEHYLDDEE